MTLWSVVVLFEGLVVPNILPTKLIVVCVCLVLVCVLWFRRTVQVASERRFVVVSVAVDMVILPC